MNFMSRTVYNFLLDVFLFLVLVSLLFASIVLRFVFPVPATATGWKLWGLGHETWTNLQFALITLLVLAVLLHVMLHWSWVCSIWVTKLRRHPERNTKPNEGTQTLWGVTLLIAVFAILGLLVGIAQLTIESPNV